MVKSELDGVNSDGFITTRLPAEKMLPRGPNAKLNGKFHGTITPTLPSGWYSILVLAPNKPKGNKERLFEGLAHFRIFLLAYFKDERVPKISVAKLPSGLLWPKSSLSAFTICSEFSTRREITLSILFILRSMFIPSESAAALCFLIRF